MLDVFSCSHPPLQYSFLCLYPPLIHPSVSIFPASEPPFPTAQFYSASHMPTSQPTTSQSGQYPSPPNQSKETDRPTDRPTDQPTFIIQLALEIEWAKPFQLTGQRSGVECLGLFVWFRAFTPSLALVSYSASFLSILQVLARPVYIKSSAAAALSLLSLAALRLHKLYHHSQSWWLFIRENLSDSSETWKSRAFIIHFPTWWLCRFLALVDLNPPPLSSASSIAVDLWFYLGGILAGGPFSFAAILKSFCENNRLNL